MTILRQTSQDTVLCIIGSQSFDIGEMFLIRSTESQILSRACEEKSVNRILL